MRPETATATAERGLRRRCASCGAPFYDLRRDPIVCPKCGATLVSRLPLRRERPRPTPTGRDAEPVVVTAAEAAAEDDKDEESAAAEDDDEDAGDDTDAEPALDDERDDEPDDADEPAEPGEPVEA